MHILPSSHGSGVYRHASPDDTHIDYSMVELPKPDDVSKDYDSMHCVYKQIETFQTIS